jgi:Cu-Zn family superoxide dismutase
MTGLTPGFHNWHVHEYGDLGLLPDGQNSGADVSGHFVGLVTDRTPGTLQEVGALDNSKPIWADSHGYARGEFIDNQIRLNGPNAIVGRSIIVHGDGSSAATRVAEGAIGKRRETVVYDADIGPVDQPVQFAVAHVVYTSLAGNQVLLGRVTFTQPSPDSEVAVHYEFSGLSPSAMHPWHIHQYGDLLSWDSVQSVSGHFIGQNPVRAVGQKQEIGNLNDGTPLSTDASGAVTGDYIDSQVKLSGINSVVGRAVVVHVPTTVAAGVPRMAWGVIGIAPYNSASALQPTWLLLVLIICAIVRMW